ncbi:Stk1 family PASTA domain-containing Ser/Thr kinase [Paenibacillus sp. GSMTC-2017]|uniref:Stk1 family PASTA domain-containing Ser/Thr kinase n=1 Tax=Paenibacillus sp. GSMTC-2017 TaxID=2794350 RepID=UPI0018D8D7E4|nr:Stk1 family PASTA domain-containing Ser/Thr kinase [Paenibacillus sp. GSMTC-2017]MBH5316754.1 Stk1 family PASTA domain-containing Ser/Thr kinase [Paenibacillus sp. GSMTC-2017]
MIGHDLGGRYEILSRIGGGGMALVYKAHDVLLNRKVAVKVLRQQFVNDDEFIRRFRREAQSAAALSHPNVVSIYDVGQEDETHYIVMEYIEGNNLNELIQERAPLQAEEAVRFAVQICDALGHAHQNHIIHRDIKPHNILIGNNGRVKVTDFGIARAVTSSTITHTGSVLGSVHYFSPEHAKGINTGEKSDLYSLGIVLYQMLTGKLPFLGESPISVALKHLQENIEAPRSINPHIPQSVENIILKATRKNPSERYSSAQEMLLDLDTCLRSDRLNESKTIFPMFNDLEETRVMPAIRGDIVASASAERFEPKVVVSDTSTKWADGENNKNPKKWKKPLTVVGVTLVLLALIIFGFLWLLDKLDTEEVEVPYVVGMTLADARKELESKGLEAQDPPIREFQKDIPKDQVFDQNKQNMRVKAGSAIVLYVSDGPEMVGLKNYVGQMIKAVQEELHSIGITNDRIEIKEEHNEQPLGTILEQTPASGELFDPLTVKLSFLVSKGPETVEMPDLVGEKLSTARKLLKSLGLVLKEENILYEPSYLHEKDTIIMQETHMPLDQVPKGSDITIRVSSGPPADAKSYVLNVRISPAVEGQSSEVKIVYSDARGENMEGITRTITSTVDIPVTVILAPDTVATVTVSRDNQFMDTKTISYDELVSGTGSSGLTIPGEELVPPTQNTEEQPVQGEVNGSDGESTTEGESEGSEQGQ